MKEKCPDIFLLEPKQRDRQRVDTAGNCKDLDSQKIFRKNRYLEKIVRLLLCYCFHKTLIDEAAAGDDEIEIFVGQLEPEKFLLPATEILLTSCL